ncbi:MAG: Dabb family protein [Planctomycetota bacterium]
MLKHIVFFRLKDPAQTQALIDHAELLLKPIPTVRGFSIGTPADTPVRDVVQRDYHVGMVVTFDDVAGHDVYGPHPKHDEFVALHKDDWEDVRVFDVEVPDVEGSD